MQLFLLNAASVSIDLSPYVAFPHAVTELQGAFPQRLPDQVTLAFKKKSQKVTAFFTEKEGGVTYFYGYKEKPDISPDTEKLALIGCCLSESQWLECLTQVLAIDSLKGLCINFAQVEGSTCDSLMAIMAKVLTQRSQETPGDLDLDLGLNDITTKGTIDIMTALINERRPIYVHRLDLRHSDIDIHDPCFTKALCDLFKKYNDQGTTEPLYLSFRKNKKSMSPLIAYYRSILSTSLGRTCRFEIDVLGSPVAEGVGNPLTKEFCQSLPSQLYLHGFDIDSTEFKQELHGKNSVAIKSTGLSLDFSASLESFGDLCAGALYHALDKPIGSVTLSIEGSYPQKLDETCVPFFQMLRQIRPTYLNIDAKDGFFTSNAINKMLGVVSGHLESLLFAHKECDSSNLDALLSCTRLTYLTLNCRDLNNQTIQDSALDALHTFQSLRYLQICPSRITDYTKILDACPPHLRYLSADKLKADNIAHKGLLYVFGLVADKSRKDMGPFIDSLQKTQPSYFESYNTGDYVAKSAYDLMKLFFEKQTEYVVPFPQYGFSETEDERKKQWAMLAEIIDPSVHGLIKND